MYAYQAPQIINIGLDNFSTPKEVLDINIEKYFDEMKEKKSICQSELLFLKKQLEEAQIQLEGYKLMIEIAKIERI